MPNNMENVVNDFIKQIKDILGKKLKKVILYGSYARGDYNYSSDVDIMILADVDRSEIMEYTQKIWEISADIEIDEGIVISPIIRNIDNFIEWQDVKPFYINIVNEGVVLVGEEN